MSVKDSPASALSEEEVFTSAAELAQVFSEKRKLKNLSIEQIAKEMHLSPKQLAPFEAGNVSLKALSNFERGYLRNYAAFLEVDLACFEDELLSEVDLSADLQAIGNEVFLPQKSTGITPFKVFGFLIGLGLAIGLVILNL